MNRIIMIQEVKTKKEIYYRLASHAYTSRKVYDIHKLMLNHCAQDDFSLINKGKWRLVHMILREHNYDVFIFTLEDSEKLLQDCVLIYEECN